MIKKIAYLKEKIKVQLWGRQKGFIRVPGDKFKFPKPRVRDKRSRVRLKTYEKMQSKTQWGEDITEIISLSFILPITKTLYYPSTSDYIFSGVSIKMISY